MAFFRRGKRKGHGPFCSSFLLEKAEGKRSHAPCLISKISGWKMKGRDAVVVFSRRASAPSNPFSLKMLLPIPFSAGTPPKNRGSLHILSNPIIEKSHLRICVKPVLSTFHNRKGSARLFRKIGYGLFGGQVVPLAI